MSRCLSFMSVASKRAAVIAHIGKPPGEKDCRLQRALCTRMFVAVNPRLKECRPTRSHYGGQRDRLENAEQTTANCQKNGCSGLQYEKFP